MPHGMCLNWETALVWFQIVGDALIAIGFGLIAYALIILRTRLDIKFSRFLVISFATLMGACALTHILSIVVMFWSDYWLEGLMKYFTGVAAVSTAMATMTLVSEKNAEFLDAITVTHHHDDSKK
jgi:ethanolamine transporter EutH